MGFATSGEAYAWVSPQVASYFSLLAQKKLTKRKCTLADGRCATAIVTRCLVAPVRRALLARAALEWPSLAIHTSRASFLSILKGEVKSRARAGKQACLFAEKESVFQADSTGWLATSETFANRKLAAEPTGMYLWRVSEVANHLVPHSVTFPIVSFQATQTVDSK